MKHPLFYFAILLIIVTSILLLTRPPLSGVDYLVYVTSDHDANTITLWRISAFTPSEKLREIENSGISSILIDNDQVYISTETEFIYQTRYDLHDETVGTLLTSAGRIGRLVAISPDEQWLYYVRDRDLYRLRVDGSRGELIMTDYLYAVQGWHDSILVFTTILDNRQIDLYFHDSNKPYAVRVAQNITPDVALTQDAVLYSVKSEDSQGTPHYRTYLQAFDDSPPDVIAKKISRNGVWSYDGQRIYNSGFSALEVYDPPDWEPHIIDVPHFEGLHYATPETLFYFGNTGKLDLYSSDADGHNVHLVIKNLGIFPSEPYLHFHGDWVLTSRNQLFLAHKSGFGYYLSTDGYISSAGWTSIPAPVPTSHPILLFATAFGMFMVVGMTLFANKNKSV